MSVSTRWYIPLVATLLLASMDTASGQVVWEVQHELTIGSFDGPVMFGSITGLAITPSGDILVLDRLDGQVRVFAPDGSLRTSFGQKGEGPGELSETAMSLLVMADGTVIIPDLGNARVSLFSADYAFDTSFRLDPLSLIAFRWATLGDLILKEVRPFPSMPGLEPRGPTEPGVIALNREGQEVATLLTFQTGQSTEIGPDLRVRVRMFDDRPVWAVTPQGHLASGVSGRYELDFLDADGKRVGRIRRDVGRRAVPEEMKRESLATFEAQLANSQLPPEALARIEPPEFADSLPVIAGVHHGPQGTILVSRGGGLIDEYSEQRPARDPEAAGMSMDVFSAERAYLGVLELPRILSHITALGDRIYGVVKDEYDVETVVVYSVRPTR